MKKYSKKITKEETGILRAAEAGEFVPVKNKKRSIEKYSRIAKLTMKKNKVITIRISEIDLTKLKAKAAEEGLPYQTLISSSLHKLVK